jgi:hypothetical protein
MRSSSSSGGGRSSTASAGRSMAARRDRAPRPGRRPGSCARSA